MALVAARRLLVKLPKHSLPALQAVRHCSFHKKPFLETLDTKVELEGPEAPKWHDDNNEFWEKAEDYVKDQPDDSFPWFYLMAVVGPCTFVYLYYKILLEEGSAGRPWISDYINQDKYLMWGLDPDFITEEDQALIDARREHAKTIPLLTRIMEFLQPWHIYTVMDQEVELAKRYSRSVMAFYENKVRYLKSADIAKANQFDILTSTEIYRTSPSYVDATMVHYKDI